MPRRPPLAPTRWYRHAARWGRALGRQLAEFSRDALELVLPATCTYCGLLLGERCAGPLLCADCLGAMRLDRPLRLCRRCASPVPAVVAAAERCIRCRGRRYGFAESTALGVYQGPLAEAVVRAKRAADEPLAMALGELLAAHVASRYAGQPFDLIVPAPVDWMRQLLRGTSCPAVLAEMCHRRLQTPVALDLLACRRKIRKQGTLMPAERFRNVRGALAVTSGYAITGARILLVDDVMTTGATASEAARALRQAGARRVSVAVVARGTGSY